MMKTGDHTNYYRKIRKKRGGIWDALGSRVLERLSHHVSHCPRCQQRLAIVNRVEIAMMLIKTQPLDAGLLARANNKALDTLKHSLRKAPQSAALRTTQPDLSRFEKIRPGLERVMNTAACLFVVLMIKTGISSSLIDYREQGETVIHNYYARNLDSQIFDEIFPKDSSPNG
jgi:hypothetical protein